MLIEDFAVYNLRLNRDISSGTDNLIEKHARGLLH